MNKLSTEQVKDYLKSKIKIDNWYIGKVDNNKEKAIALYSNKRKINQISKYPYQTYSILPITLLLRYSKFYNLAEEKANEIYMLLKNSKFFIAEYECFSNLIDEGPSDLRYRPKSAFMNLQLILI